MGGGGGDMILWLETNENFIQIPPFSIIYYKGRSKITFTLNRK